MIDQVLRGGSIEASVGTQDQAREGRAAVGTRTLAEIMKDGQRAGGTHFENCAASGEGIVGAGPAAALGCAVESAIAALHERPNEVTAAAGRRY